MLTIHLLSLSSKNLKAAASSRTSTSLSPLIRSTRWKKWERLKVVAMDAPSSHSWMVFSFSCKNCLSDFRKRIRKSRSSCTIWSPVASINLFWAWCCSSTKDLTSLPEDLLLSFLWFMTQFTTNSAALPSRSSRMECCRSSLISSKRIRLRPSRNGQSHMAVVLPVWI